MKLDEINAGAAPSADLVHEYAGLLWNENDAMDAYGDGRIWERAKARMKEIEAAVAAAVGKEGLKKFKADARKAERAADKMFFASDDTAAAEKHPVIQWAFNWQAE